MPKPTKTRILYRGIWTLPSSRQTLRDQHNALADVLDDLGLELLEIPHWESEGTYNAIIAGDLHSVFAFITMTARRPDLLRSMEFPL